MRIRITYHSIDCIKEAELVVPESFKGSLLEYTDMFWFSKFVSTKCNKMINKEFIVSYEEITNG